MSGDADRDRSNRRDAGFSDLVGSMLGFAGASTRFAIQQMENAFVAFTNPQKVMNRMRHSLDNISNAMSQSGDESGNRSGRSQSFQGAQSRRSDPVSAASAMDPTGTTQESQNQGVSEDVMTGRKR